MSNDRELRVVPFDDVDGGESQTESFGERSLARTGETISTALAERAKAEVSALCIMAERRQRSIAEARKRLLKDCERPAFASVAIYKKPVGEGVEGPSIRMAEAAARAMGNILSQASAIYDDREKRIVRVVATDLECNLTYHFDVTIAKTIERSKRMPGRNVLMERKNSKGYPVYVIEAIDDEIMDKERALISKATRTCLLRLIPGDILEEAMEACYRVREAEIKADLPRARERMVAAFEALGVTIAQLSDYLGHAIGDVTAEEVNALRSLHAALKDKETTWAEVMDQKRATAEPTAVQPTDVADRLTKKAAAVKNGPAPEPVAESAH